MNVAPTAARAANRRPATSTIDGLVRSITIPPRPSLLTDLQKEIADDDPDFRRIARIVGADVALSAAVLRSVNSPFYALTRRAETLEQAVSLVGLRQVGVLVTGLVLRQVLRVDGTDLHDFWIRSDRRAFAMTQLAVGLRGVATDIAHSFGLFCDVGIALLMPRFPDYAQTLQHAARATDRNFTDVEQAAHRTDHALIGALMARTWSLSTTVCAAIRQHHDAAVLVHPETPEPVARLVAMGMLAELAIQRHAGQAECAEWKRAGPSASATLHLGDGEVEGWISRLCEGFDAT